MRRMSDYMEMRKASLSLYPKLMDAMPAVKVDPGQVAKRLGMRRSGSTVVLNDETERVGFMDFVLFGCRIGGQLLVDRLRPHLVDLTELESELCDACSRNRTSLFRAVSWNVSQHQVVLEDLLEPDRPPVDLSDIHLSKSFENIGVQLLVFARVVTLREISMTTGFALTFEPDDLAPLLQSYRQKLKSVPTDELPERRFAFFFQKHRAFGLEQRFEDTI